MFFNIIYTHFQLDFFFSNLFFFQDGRCYCRPVAAILPGGEGVYVYLVYVEYPSIDPLPKASFALYGNGSGGVNEPPNRLLVGILMFLFSLVGVIPEREMVPVGSSTNKLTQCSFRVLYIPFILFHFIFIITFTFQPVS